MFVLHIQQCFDVLIIRVVVLDNYLDIVLDFSVKFIWLFPHITLEKKNQTKLTITHIAFNRLG